MEMNWGRVYAGLAVVYYVVAWYGLHLFDAGLVTTGLFLFGVPAVLLIHFSYAPTAVLVSIGSIGLAVAIVLEGIAHVYGLWYTIGIDAGRLFGVIPVEILIVTTMEVMFLALLYELLFDDGVYNQHTAASRLGAIGVCIGGALALFWLYTTFAIDFFVSYSFAWILLLIAACSLAALSVYRVYTPQFLDRLVHFAAVGAIPSLIGLALAVTNTHKVFAFQAEYLYSFAWFGETVPLEAVLLAVALPFFVATIYELYLDDKS